MSEIVPVVVLGAGPAGLSAALWLQHYALSPVVVDPREGGGLQAVSPYANVTLLGHVGTTAREVAARFRAHADSVGVRVVRAACTGIARDGDALVIQLAGADPIACRALVVATGTRFRALDVPGADDAIARRHLRYIAPEPAFDDARGKDAVVVGGGDNAFYVAGQLAPIARTVTIVVRSRIRAHKAQRTPVLAAANVVVRTGWDVASFEPGAVVLRQATGGLERVEAHIVYNAVGYVPNTALVEDALGTALDEDGYILVDGNCRTSAPRVWAAGDVANPGHPCSATAIAYGTIAARDVERTLDEADSPEGSGRDAWALSSPAFLLTGERRRRVRGAAGS